MKGKVSSIAKGTKHDYTFNPCEGHPIREKQPLVDALITLNSKPQPTSLYWITKKLSETYKLTIQLAKKAWWKYKITKRTNWLTRNFKRNL